jgi:RNA polymerase sigma-70 factor (ECF subfamily)
MRDNPAIPNIETLYFNHHGWLKAWLRRRLGDTNRAADLAHDTFVRLLSRQGLNPLDEPRAFLTTVATRVLASYWRREQLEQAYLDTLRCFAPALAPSPEERAIVLETLHQLDELLDGLPVPVKRAFLLSQLDGLTQRQIALQLNITERTVRRHLTRAAEQCYFADVLGAGR